LGISPEKRIVLHLGMMGPEVLSTEIAAVSRCWPEEWVLVFHERFSRSLDDPVVKEVLNSGGDRVFLSLEPVDLDDLPKVVASADVGLVFYNPAMGPNYAVITGASGKLAYYLQAGVPVICLDLPGFDELMTDGQCGVCVPSPAAIGSALEVLTTRLPEFGEAARRCFDERYAFDRFFLPLVEEIKGELHAPG
jgi:glycosyltransferase involved in cell wall biosynthesis